MRTGDYKRLKVWQKSIELVEKVYAAARTLPKEETYALADQMRRAVVSIPSNIAEGHGRGSDKECVQFLFIARGSLFEIETQIELCRRLGYVRQEETADLLELTVEISKMLNALISYRMSISSRPRPLSD